ncbi:hypothetical protein DPEC_G00257930 [Dallia pectoralis]|uniref:Uncharacterized protein n=1 Tax=Dallia pectoralis TaxID=75939 RepID=A0ACC2FQY6_DALPE|nr:hypothetical protein DPEC_G00257930 [Dallia pectoralis]
MELLLVCVMYSIFVEMEMVRQHQGRRRLLMCRHLCRQRSGIGNAVLYLATVCYQEITDRTGIQPNHALHYCVINATVPVLQRYYGGEDTRPDNRLGREAMHQLMVALKTDRQHGWGPTLETLVFLFWLATGSAYRVVSRVFKHASSYSLQGPA